MIVVGTRPEAIKLAPVILELKKIPWANVTLLTTSQHKEMMHQVLNFFDISADIDLSTDKHNNMQLCQNRLHSHIHNHRKHELVIDNNIETYCGH